MTVVPPPATASPFMPQRLTMEGEMPEFMLYPDFTSTTEVSRVYTVGKLKTILTDCGITTTGSPTKVKLVKLVCLHALVQVSLLEPDHVDDMTDVQVITALQQLGQSGLIPRELEARRAALRDALAAARGALHLPPGTTPVPPATSSERMHQQLIELVGTLQAQIQRQAQETAALRTAMGKLESGWARGQDRADGRGRQDKQDD
eukprot:1378194-Rhodomonas_salina.2